MVQLAWTEGGYFSLSPRLYCTGWRRRKKVGKGPASTKWEGNLEQPRKESEGRRPCRARFGVTQLARWLILIADTCDAIQALSIIRPWCCGDQLVPACMQHAVWICALEQHASAGLGQHCEHSNLRRISDQRWAMPSPGKLAARQLTAYRTL